MAGPLDGAEVLITAGPTYEFLDDVRYLGNPSTGRMGIELAEAAREAGGIVSVVMGPTHLLPPPGVQVVNVVSATEMMEAVAERFEECDVFIASAAVSDYRPSHKKAGKIKKGPKKKTLELIKNPDILRTVTKKRRDDQVVVGFSLESRNLMRNGRKKLQKKRCDLMVVNTPGHFGEAREIVWVLNKRGTVAELSPSGKRAIARKIIELAGRLRGRETLQVIKPFDEGTP